MKTYLAILVVSAAVVVLAASSMAVAQAAKREAAPVAKAQRDRLENLKARARANAASQGRLYLRDGRPVLRAELIFVRRICELDVEHFRRAHRDAEAALKEAAEKYADDWQRGRAHSPLPPVDGPSVLQGSLTAIMKKDLSPDQFARYQAEVKKRDAERKWAGVRYFVAAIDRELFLSDRQRQQISQALVANWGPRWDASLAYGAGNNWFSPPEVDHYVRPLLEADQKKVWLAKAKAQMAGRSAIFEYFISDNDGLETELGEAQQAGRDDRVPIQRGPAPQRPVLKPEATGAFAGAPVAKANAAPVRAKQAPIVGAQAVIALNRVNRMMWGGLGAAGRRAQLDSLLLVRITELERTCCITEAQKQKLLLAGHGDIKRFFDSVDELNTRTTQGENDLNNALVREASVLAAELNRGLFGDGSIFSKTIRRTLNHDQAVRFERAARERAALGFRSTVNWFVIQLDQGLGLTELQRRQFAELLESDVRPSRRPGQDDHWYLLWQTSRLPEEKLKPIFDAPQWRLLSRQLALGGAREQLLKANGALADDTKPAEQNANHAASVLPAVPAARNAANDPTTKSHN